jgi:hypothetical protein
MTTDISRIPKGNQLPATSLEVDFSLVLARTINSIKNDPSQLRNAIYELARIKLQNEALGQYPHMSILELRRLMLALETAIERVETHSSQDEFDAVQPARYLTNDQVRLSNHLIFDQSSPIPYQSVTAREASIPFISTRKQSWFRPASLIRGGIVAIVMVALCVIVTLPRLATSSTPNVIQKADTPEPSPMRPGAQPQSPGFPLPTVYGVYAISNGQLYELEVLPGRVPDQRVSISAPVKTPSRTLLADGRIAFIVFRRDVATSAPDRMSVRVIAKVLRAMTFSSAGNADTTMLDDQWAIRGASYEFRVGPVSENPEMLLVRPEKPDFLFPPGRYGLVLKGQAYDFSVAGPITESVQCLERVEAANGSFYSECRSR